MSAPLAEWGTLDFTVDPLLGSHAERCSGILYNARVDAPRRQRVYVFVCGRCGWHSPPFRVTVRGRPARRPGQQPLPFDDAGVTPAAALAAPYSKENTP